LLEKIKSGDVKSLIGKFTVSSKASNAMLGIMTGSTVNSQKNRDLTLRSLNPEVYDEIIKKQKEQQKLSDFEEKWKKYTEKMIGGDAF